MTACVAQHYAVGRFRSPGDVYTASSTGGTDGSTSMVRVVVLKILRAPSGTQKIAGQRNFGEANAAGWGLLSVSGNLRWEIGDGGQAVRTATVSPDLEPGDLVVACMSYDGSTLRLLAAGVFGSDASASGYTTATQALTVGTDPSDGSNAAEDFAVLALLGTESEALTSQSALETLDAEIDDALVHGRDLDGAPSGFTVEWYYDAADLAIDNDPWTDRLSQGEDMARAGSPELRSVSARVAA